MGVQMSNHYDEATAGWITDEVSKPAAIIERESGRVVLKFETPLRTEEDKAAWSADSRGLAVAHRANKTTDLKVLFLEGGAFIEGKLPELPEADFKLKRPRFPGREQHSHLGHDQVLPLRWITPATLMVSRELSTTYTSEVATTYTRRIFITLGFNAQHEAAVRNVTREKQRVVTGD